MSRVYYFLLLVTLIFQHLTFLRAISPAPAPGPYDPSHDVPSPAPGPYGPSHDIPSPAPGPYAPSHDVPSPAPGPYAPSHDVPSPSPTYIPPTPSPSWPSPSDHNNGDSPPSPAPQSTKPKSSSKGMSGGQKAGLAFGVVAGAALLGFAGMVYAKRRKNILRSQNISSVQLGTAFVRRPSP